MAWFRRHSASPGTSASDIATGADKHSAGGHAAAVFSAIALAFSAHSLWETSLKQAELSVSPGARPGPVPFFSIP